MEDLIKAIKTSIPIVIEEWNSKKVGQFEKLFEHRFNEYFENKETQEKTKIISPIIDTIFARIMSQQLDNFIIDEGKGRDYRWNDIPLESKLTLSLNNSWTGNGYEKTNYHILSKFELGDDGQIISYFSCLVNLSECLSSWTKPDTKSNFSTLKFVKEDYEKIIPIHGEVISSKKLLHFHLVSNKKNTQS